MNRRLVVVVLMTVAAIVLVQVAAQAQAIAGLFDAAERALAPSEDDAAATFLGAFTILVREGIDSISLNPDAVINTRLSVAALEAS